MLMARIRRPLTRRSEFRTSKRMGGHEDARKAPLCFVQHRRGIEMGHSSLLCMVLILATTTGCTYPARQYGNCEVGGMVIGGVLGAAGGALGSEYAVRKGSTENFTVAQAAVVTVVGFVGLFLGAWVGSEIGHNLCDPLAPPTPP
jgi:uncharacterized membrane protein YfcA